MAMYVKLFERMLRSSVWAGQPLHVRVAWVGLLLLARPGYLEDGTRVGIVYGTRLALARALDMDPEQFSEALDLLMSPDPDSTSPEWDGRRVIEVAKNTYAIPQYWKYREMRDGEMEREEARLRMRARRAAERADANTSEKGSGTSVDVRERSDCSETFADVRDCSEVFGDVRESSRCSEMFHDVPDVRHAEAEAEAEAEAYTCIGGQHGLASETWVEDTKTYPPPFHRETPDEKPTLTWHCKGKPDTWVLWPSAVKRLEALYAGMDVQAVIQRLYRWHLANPNRRKTARGMPRFIIGALNREQSGEFARERRPKPSAARPGVNWREELPPEKRRCTVCGGMGIVAVIDEDGVEGTAACPHCEVGAMAHERDGVRLASPSDKVLRGGLV
jgi:hypothetical protein